jgi:UTP-glucose-1-phosphate uridylyltransferase
LTLVVLAAGLGRRFGGLKQFEPVGPAGEALMDYSVLDAFRAGFTRAVFVVRRDIRDHFERSAAVRYRAHVEVVTVLQEGDALPSGCAARAGRQRPWGTAHAVLAAREAVTGPFAVLNADDLYGPEALGQVAAFLGAAHPGEHAVIGYQLGLAVSPSGRVNRALLEHRADGTLLQVREVEDLVQDPDGWYSGRAAGAVIRLSPRALVSMNLWGFTPGIFPVLENALRRFLTEGPREEAECHLPGAVQDGVAGGTTRVRVLPTTSRWCGMTHPSDRDWVRSRVAELVSAGVYPERLWE